MRKSTLGKGLPVMVSGRGRCPLPLECPGMRACADRRYTHSQWHIWCFSQYLWANQRTRPPTCWDAAVQPCRLRPNAQIRHAVLLQKPGVSRVWIC